MGWLAHRLAQDGNIVIGAHHHGNTGREPYHAAGFVCGWERALDLSALLSNLSDEGPFAGRFDLDRVHAIGFSIGGYTALALAGALTSMERYFSWAMENGGFASGPREFPDVASQVPYLLESSRPFRTSWARQGESFKDDRIGTVTAIAPAPPVRAFDEGSVGAISVPVTLVAGEADQEAPSRDCADWLQLANPTFRRVRVGNDVGHYTFLGFPAGDVPDDLNFIFSDNPGVNREAVHDATADAVLAAFKRA
ncbi:MAG: dienelactone hydrolase [Pseudomonadota bacterium]